MKKLSEYECKVGVEVKGEHFERVRAALVELEACEVPLFRTHLEGGPESGPLFPIYGPTAERSERAVFYLLCDGADQGLDTLRKELSDRTRWLEEISNTALAAGIDGNLGIVEGIKGALSRLAEAEERIKSLHVIAYATVEYVIDHSVADRIIEKVRLHGDVPKATNLVSLIEELLRGKRKAEAERDAAAKRAEEAEASVDYWRTKAKCYGDIVHGCSPALERAGFPVDSKGPGGGVAGIARSVDALAAKLAEAAMQRDAWYSRAEAHRQAAELAQRGAEVAEKSLAEAGDLLDVRHRDDDSPVTLAEAIQEMLSEHRITRESRDEALLKLAEAVAVLREIDENRALGIYSSTLAARFLATLAPETKEENRGE